MQLHVCRFLRRRFSTLSGRTRANGATLDSESHPRFEVTPDSFHLTAEERAPRLKLTAPVPATR
jgi:hypothetical protein